MKKEQIWSNFYSIESKSLKQGSWLQRTIIIKHSVNPSQWTATAGEGEEGSVHPI